MWSVWKWKTGSARPSFSISKLRLKNSLCDARSYRQASIRSGTLPTMPGPQPLCLHQKTNGEISSRVKQAVIPMFLEFSNQFPCLKPCVSYHTQGDLT